MTLASMASNVFWVSYALLWLLLVIQGLAFLEVLRQVGLLRRQVAPQQGAMIVPNAIEAGSALPDLVAVAASDREPASWDRYLTDEFGVVVFLTTHCSTCRLIAQELSGFSRDVPANVRVVAVVDTRAGAAEDFLADTGIDPEIVALDGLGETAKRIGIGWTPGALTVKARTMNRAAIVNDIFQIDSLLSEELAEVKDAQGRLADEPTTISGVKATSQS